MGNNSPCSWCSNTVEGLFQGTISSGIRVLEVRGVKTLHLLIKVVMVSCE